MTAINNLLDWCPEGAYIALDNLIAARFSARDLHLLQRRRALNALAGPNKSNFRGRGIDFEEVRPYQAGDDIRSIDWRVTARSDRPYTKLFSEERERPLLVVCDQRQPMFFGSVNCFKSTLACYISALIAWAGLQQGDRVGGLVMGNEQQREIRPKRSRQSTLALMNLLLHYNQQLNRDTGIDTDHNAGLEAALAELRRIAKPGSAIFLISDFSGFEQPQIQKQLHQLSKHCEITAIKVYDPLEKKLPPPGRYTVTDGHQRSIIDSRSRQLKTHYQQFVEQREQQLNAVLGKLGIPLISIGTQQPPLGRLLQYYGV